MIQIVTSFQNGNIVFFQADGEKKYKSCGYTLDYPHKNAFMNPAMSRNPNAAGLGFFCFVLFFFPFFREKTGEENTTGRS